MTRLAYISYVPLLFLSAFLLFMVQPMASRIILPVLGGTPAVWTTSMLFFQVLLLGGYAWAHFNARYFPLWLSPLMQCGLAVLGFVSINYFNIGEAPDFESGRTVYWQFTTMLGMIGISYLALAVNAPLYQRLFSHFSTKEKKLNPYPLYAISNVGSFLALLSYPFIVEPMFGLKGQTALWTDLYMALLAFIFLAGLLTLKQALNLSKEKKAEEKQEAAQIEKVKASDMGKWFLWAFIPSSMMLGVTTFVTTDVASAPLLWIIPLALYLLSFSITFASPPLFIAKDYKVLTQMTLVIVAIVSAFMSFSILNHSWTMIVMHYGLFFFAATLCHATLSRMKPEAEHLTFFFLIVSFGGCAGGIFNAIFAPILFVYPIEYALILCVMVFALSFTDKDREPKRSDNLFLIISLTLTVIGLSLIHLFKEQTALFAPILILAMIMAYELKRVFALIMAICFTSFFVTTIFMSGNLLHIARNDFGTLMVIDEKDTNIRFFMHGTTRHGSQKLPLGEVQKPITYYHPASGLGLFYRYFDDQEGDQRVGVLGLGTGNVSCYMREGRVYDFYEINEEVVDIAENPELFTHLRDCAGEHEVMLGDARIELQKKENELYDMLFIDVFSSDAIPLHLATLEAMKIYFEKTKADGVVVFHISNRYFDLEPIIHAQLKELGYHGVSSVFVPTPRQEEEGAAVPSHYVFMARDRAILDAMISYDTDKQISELAPVGDKRIWDDNYVNIFDAVRLGLSQNQQDAFERMIERHEAEEAAAESAEEGTEEKADDSEGAENQEPDNN